LENVHIASDWNLNAFRFPVQWVNRPNNPRDPKLHDFRGVQRSNRRGHRENRAESDGAAWRVEEHREGHLDLRRSLPEAFSPQSITLRLEHDIDISRGDMIIGRENLPGMSTDLHARVCWMHTHPLQRGKKYF